MTSVTRWDPFAEMNRLHDAFVAGRRAEYKPAVDIHESDEAFTLFVEVPGIQADQVHVDLEKNVLTIRAERSETDEVDAEGYRRVERYRGSFTRSFSLPETVDDETIEAKLADGVLTLRLPKRPAPSTRRIAVQN